MTTCERICIFFPALTFLIPIIVANIAEAVFYGLNVLWIGAAISLTSVYLNMQNQVSYIDALSDLFTRQYMIACLLPELKKPQASKRMVGIMLDINKFKSINDSFGHLVGDDAIRSAGRILQIATPRGAKAYRFGGDEFVLIQMVKNEQEALDTVERIRATALSFNGKGIRPYRLGFSIGYTIFDYGKDDLDTFLGRMDQAMYMEKKKRKE